MRGEMERQYKRMVVLLERLATENESALFRTRWPYNHEPLRHDAANILRDIGHSPIMRIGTRLVGSDPE